MADKKQIEYGKTEEFFLFPWNPRKKVDKKYHDLKDNIKEKGMIDPVRVRETPLGKEIWDGEHRYEIAKDLEIEEIPYINYGDMDDNEVKAKRASIALEAGDIDAETLYEEFNRCQEEENMDAVAIADRFGRSVSTVRKGIRAWKEREEGSGSSVDEDKREQISLDSWYDIAQLPDDMKEEAVEKRASGELEGRDLKKIKGHTGKEPKKDQDKESITEQEDASIEDTSEDTSDDEQESEDTGSKTTSIPILVEVYVKENNYKKLERLTDENESVGEKIISMVKYCLNKDIDL